MPTPVFALHDFAPAHLDGAVRLSREAGWPHRAQDWRFNLDLGRGVVAVSQGEVVGTALAIPFGAVAMTSMIIVDRRLRGRGLGRGLVERAMTLAAPDEWRLVATPEGLPLYEGLGFVALGRTVLQQGPAGPVAAPEGVAWAEAADEADIAAVDAVAFGADRRRLVAALMACGRLAVIREDGAIAGYAALRAFGQGEVAGPVVARDAAAARQLLTFLFAARPGRLLRVDTPSDSGLGPWLAECGMTPLSEGIVMRRGAAPAKLSAVATFALAAQALG